jgi:hypothetical protein
VIEPRCVGVLAGQAQVHGDAGGRADLAIRIVVAGPNDGLAGIRGLLRRAKVVGVDGADRRGGGLDRGDREAVEPGVIGFGDAVGFGQNVVGRAVRRERRRARATEESAPMSEAYRDRAPDLVGRLDLIERALAQVIATLERIERRLPDGNEGR